MSLDKAFYEALRESVELAGSQMKYSKKCGVAQGQISKVLVGEKVKNGEISKEGLKLTKYTKDPGMSVMGGIINGFEITTFIEFLKKIRPDLPLGIINMDGKREVKVYDISKLNKAFNKDGLDNLNHISNFKQSTISIEPIFSVRVPVEFFPSDFGVRVIGHGLEPTMPEGCAVGLSYLNSWADFIAGEVYLCNLPYEGLVLRQVVVAQDHAGLEFQQLHPDKMGYRSQIHHPEKARDMIIARKSWVATRG